MFFQERADLSSSASKKHVIKVSLMGMFVSGLCVWGSIGFADNQTAADTDVPRKPPSSENLQIKQVKEEADRDAKELESEKRQITKEKKDLETKASHSVQSLDQSQEEKSVLLEKIEAIKKKEAVIEVKEEALKEKKAAYEKFKDIMTRKINILGGVSVTHQKIVLELDQIYEELEKIELSKRNLLTERKKSEEDIKDIERDVQAKSLLLDLNEGDEQSLQESIRSQKEKHATSQDYLSILQKKEELLDIQIGFLSDYQQSLEERLWVYLKKDFLTQKPYRPDRKEIAGVMFFLLGSLCLLGIRRKAQKYFPIRKKILMMFTMSVIVYLGICLMGYHFFAYYLATRLLLSVFAVFLARGIYRSVIYISKREIEKKTSDDDADLKEQTERPLYNLFCGFLFILLLGMTLYSLIKIWGIGKSRLVAILEFSQKPWIFFGDTKISVEMILKAGIAIWAFLIVSRFLNSFLSKNIYPKTKIEESMQYALSIFIKYALIIVGIGTGLSVLGIKLSAITVIAGTVGIGIGLGLQEIAKNFISGLIMLIERPIKVGDYIEVGDLPGKVRDIKARGTVVDTFDNISVIVPNADFMSQHVVNWSYSDKTLRLHIPVGVAYGSDTALVKKLLLEVAEQHPKVLKRRGSVVRFDEFGDSSLNFQLLIWINDPESRYNIRSDLNFMIDKIFRDHNITIPFPQRDLHIRSSDVAKL